MVLKIFWCLIKEEQHFLDMHSEIYFTLTHESDNHTLKCTEKEEDGELSEWVCSMLSRDRIEHMHNHSIGLRVETYQSHTNIYCVF